MKDDAAGQPDTLRSDDSERQATELRRSSVNLDSTPIRAAATRIDISAVDAERASLEDRFSLDLPLGRGGMGTVQRALDRRLLRDVAVKIIHGHLDWGPHQARFAREAQVTAQLQHPNIVPVYSFERSDDGSAAIVMQLVDGETLSRYLAACRQAVAQGGEVPSPYRLDDRLERLIKVCDAVQYAHDHGVIHRDLKPANIMLGTHGEVYVMDWGLAGVAGASDEVVRASSMPSPPLDPPTGDPFESGTRRTSVSGMNGALTRVGDVFGTPQYMSPEQARGDTPRVGPASDQFALGLLFFELLFLEAPRKPLPDGDPMAAALAGETEPPRHAYGCEVPAALHAVLRKVTAVEPAQRYSSVGAFAEDLRCVLRDEAPSVMPESSLQRAWRRFNHNPVRAMRSVVAVVALAALTITGMLYLKLRDERRMVDERARVAEVSARVSARAQHIENALAQVEAALSGWAAAAEQALSFSVPSAPDALEIGEMRLAGRAAGLRYSPRHAQDVSYAHPSYLVPATGNAPLAETQLGRLAHLTPQLERWVGSDASARPADAEQTDGIALLWIYLALESGLLVTYPGNVNYPEGFDPRERPWYRDAFDEAHSRFRAPYKSLSGGEIQLPCVMPLRDGLGQVMGLAAVDLSLTDLRERLRLSDEPAWRASWLLDAEGRVLVSTALSPSLTPNEAAADLSARGVALEPFPIDAVNERVRSDSAGGVLELDDTLYFVQNLHRLDWTLLVSFDRERVYGGATR